VALQQPSAGKLYVNVSNDSTPWHTSRHNYWFGGEWNWDEDDAPFRIISNDSLWLNTVDLQIQQSRDSLFHIIETKTSRANNTEDARRFATHISFNIQQQDSIISLPRGFTIDSKDKFRNQQVLVTIEVPYGRQVQVSRDVKDYCWFTFEPDSRHRRYRQHWGNGRRYSSDREYIMTATGLKKVYDTSAKDNDDETDE